MYAGLVIPVLDKSHLSERYCCETRNAKNFHTYTHMLTHTPWEMHIFGHNAIKSKIPHILV